MHNVLKTTIVAAVLLALTIITAAQNQPLAFEVAVIKRSDPNAPIFRKGGECHGADRPTVNPNIPQGRCAYTHLTLKELLLFAYPNFPRSMQLDEIVIGGPSWASNDEFEVEGKAEDPSHATRDELLQMMQRLVRERFKLQSHYESRTGTGYVLSVAKGGSRLQKTLNVIGRGALTLDRNGGLLLLTGKGIALPPFAGFLAVQLKAIVEDNTDLQGGYDINLTWAPLAATGAADGPTLFTALRDIGLQLEPQKTRVEVLVVDHAEKPDAN